VENNNISKLLTVVSPGVLNLGGARMALLDIEAGFWGIRRQIEALIGARLSRLVFQQAGANGGASFVQNFIPSLDLDAPTAFSTCIQIYQSAGFGQFEIISLDWPLGRIQIEANQAFEAWTLHQNNQTSTVPTCAYTAGVLVGFINAISERKDVVCIEHSCQAMGDAVCRFELLPAAEAADQSVVALTPDPGLGRQINLLEMLFERMPMGIAVLDREFRVQRYNPTWHDFSVRYAPPEGASLVPGVGYFEHLPGSESDILPLFERALAGETIQQEGVRLESEEIVTYWDIVLAPLVENNQVVGILNVAVDATERVALKQNLEQRVVDRTREIERRRQVADSLRDMMVVLNSERSPQEIFDFITARSASLLEADACMIYSVQDQILLKESGFKLPETFSEIRSGEIYLGDANKSLLEGNPVQIPDALSYLNNLLTNSELTDFQRLWYSIIRENFASYFAFPLVVRSQLFGGLVFYYRSKHNFDTEDVQLGSILGEQAALAIENARLHQSEQDRQHELQILLDVAETANSSLELDEMLTKTLDLLVDLIGAARAGVSLLDEESGQLTAGILRPEHSVDPVDIEKMLLAGQTVIDSGEMMYVAPDLSEGLLEPGALLPLQIRGQKLGFLEIIGQEDGIFTPAQLALFKSIADQLGVAIDNARLYESAEDAAVAAERNRLARDLHDAVTQTLFSASMIADVLPKIWDRNPAEGRHRLEELRQLTRGALSEMRTLLVELRPAALEDTDLGDLIGHQVNAFIARARIPVEFERNCAQNPPPEIKEMFYRVAQETFNNIAKHAEATAVKVQFESRSDRTELVIQDDGLGFESELAQTEGLGLGIMAERARNVGAQLTIDSQVGQGTRLQVTWQNPDNKEYNHE
jgi:signal transduction histidine kinase/predicted hydrocarbon binding protein